MISLGGDILKHYLLYTENVWIQFYTFVFTKFIVIVIATIKLTTAIVTQSKIVVTFFLWTEIFNNFNCHPEDRSWSVLLQGLHRRQWRWGHKKVFYLSIIIIFTVVIYLFAWISCSSQQPPLIYCGQLSGGAVTPIWSWCCPTQREGGPRLDGADDKDDGAKDDGDGDL